MIIKMPINTSLSFNPLFADER